MFLSFYKFVTNFLKENAMFFFFFSYFFNCNFLNYVKFKFIIINYFKN